MTAARLAALLALLTATAAAATPLEDRMRDQLRATVTQLRDLQAQQAGLAAAKAQAEKERDAAKAGARPAPDAGAARALSGARGEAAAAAARASAAEAALETANARLTEAGERLNARDTELAVLRAAAAADKAAATERLTSLEACTARNMRLVATGRDLVALHEKRYGARRYEPLQLARTKIETEAQAMGDRIAKDVEPPQTATNPQ